MDIEGIENVCYSHSLSNLEHCIDKWLTVFYGDTKNTMEASSRAILKGDLIDAVFAALAVFENISQLWNGETQWE